MTYCRLHAAGSSGYPHHEEVPRGCHATARFASSSVAKNGAHSRQGREIYVTVSRRHPRQNRLSGGRGTVQRRHRRAPRYPAADRQQVAPAVFRRTPSRPGGGAARRAHSPLFPPASSLRLSAIACELSDRRRRAAGALVVARSAPRGPDARAWSRGQRRDAVALAGCGCDPALAPSSWIFPRDPQFAAKAGPILDLYAGRWEGRPLGPMNYVISADEKTSIQARAVATDPRRPRPAAPCGSSTSITAAGRWAYLAAWDVHRARLFGRCEPPAASRRLIGSWTRS